MEAMRLTNVLILVLRHHYTILETRIQDNAFYTALRENMRM